MTEDQHRQLNEFLGKASDKGNRYSQAVRLIGDHYVDIMSDSRLFHVGDTFRRVGLRTQMSIAQYPGIHPIIGLAVGKETDGPGRFGILVKCREWDSHALFQWNKRETYRP
ncbi:hypothetical protein Ciccas_008427 [Cichlidogyrus casuarinus]|uniref:Uncharacterized protein n=1 Tax=Cichlidogyrus casuarinus TaxID=1844966 RepID=A0ABD2Q003_9PLAT